MIHPCDICQDRGRCSYRLFIDCPDWCRWAAAMNQKEEENRDELE